ncbi:WAP four-disulfide core domain protein 8 [Microcaecilia unicolor]|uniref:WAP four-disulfide core domain protein 8-like n=1 Tax=Microcaecilia unicolor TaxID=1415580 RepID=A0A6P7XUT7_9AMPH|nr:WAP four-disulfide core domain protein 8-like [Microcaecilia unicolor]
MKTASNTFFLLTFINLCIYTSVSGQTTTTTGEKSGSCPLELDGLPCASGDQTPLCSSDSNCTEDEKCCNYNCKFQCVKPVQSKHGVCPEWDASICIYVRPGPGQCQNDVQCPGNMRCCYYGCKQQCVRPDVKPGKCPVQCAPSSSSRQCQDDEDCFGNSKCCGDTCQDPEPEHPGFCPNDLRSNDQYSSEIPLAPLCKCDSECQSNEKCCFFGGRKQCVKALAEKPGMCPAIMAKCLPPLPAPKCFNDGNCPQTQKCCTLCGRVCMTPAQEHDGVCPPHLGASQPCRYNSSAPTCSHDWHCATDEKCCFSGYMKQCVTSLAEKPGICPTTATAVSKTKKEISWRCKTDRDCPGSEKCCLGTEGYVCLCP